MNTIYLVNIEYSQGFQELQRNCKTVSLEPSLIQTTAASVSRAQSKNLRASESKELRDLGFLQK